MKRIIDNNKNNITGERLKQARLNKNLSQKQLSIKLELMAVYICRGSISRIENGERMVSDIEIDALSKVLDVSLDYLFGRD
ncbi:MAG: helix-turn-helix transcriptional regulator [Clostridia bacterium]|nr:helix-turn-helix transcriptional regulator [Clostridia bacterium]